MKNLFAFLFGGLFSVGLMLSGMSNPEKVLDFLDLFGDWDASLAFVMMGAILVAFIPFQKAKHNPHPTTLFNEPIDLPKNQKLTLNCCRVVYYLVSVGELQAFVRHPVLP